MVTADQAARTLFWRRTQPRSFPLCCRRLEPQRIAARCDAQEKASVPNVERLREADRAGKLVGDRPGGTVGLCENDGVDLERAHRIHVFALSTVAVCAYQ